MCDESTCTPKDPQELVSRTFKEAAPLAAPALLATFSLNEENERAYPPTSKAVYASYNCYKSFEHHHSSAEEPPIPFSYFLSEKSMRVASFTSVFPFVSLSYSATLSR